MDKKNVIRKTEEYVRKKLEGEGSGHDWWHIYRVRNIAVKIAKEESANIFVVELAALLHDIADWKSDILDELLLEPGAIACFLLAIAITVSALKKTSS